MTRHSPTRGGRPPRELRTGGALDRFVAERAARDAFSGTVLLTLRGRTVLARSHGAADRARRVPIGPGTRFALASTAKLFTAVAVQQLVRRGEVVHHERLGTYLDGLPAAIADVTLHQLLTHTSGLGDYRATEEFRAGARVWASSAELHEGIAAIIRASPLRFPPGTRFHYSNSGYELLGALVTRVSGRPYPDYIREHVFGPAGMTATGWFTRPRWDADPDFARPYTRRPSGERADVLAEKPFVGTASGDAFSTARDMARFGRALADGVLLGSAHTRHFLSGRLALPPRPDGPGGTGPVPELAFQGYGPHAILTGGQWVLRHSGGSAGTGTSLEVHPDNGWVSVVLSNHDVPEVLPIVAEARRLITADRPGHRPRTDRRSPRP
ncbi:serine hydrolase domain-containing protein [Streptomyces sp. NPDC020875]|uniref:serine hydrolase domain-containing protein n=1 Tax=Streptomyces sp. NPDC020875 TaxID=3154898 RepID=UPI0033E06DA0